MVKTPKIGFNDEDNEFGEQKEKTESGGSDTIHWPTSVPLRFKGLEYDAMSVCCGASFTMALGRLPMDTL